MQFVKELRGTAVIDPDHLNDPKVKSYLLKQISEEKMTPEAVAAAYNCSTKTILHQLGKFTNGKEVRTKLGRPPLLDEEAKTAIVARLTELVAQQKAASMKEFKEIVREGINATAARRQLFPPNRLPSESTLRALRAELDIRVNKGQTTTSARQSAQQDIRNYVSVAAMHKAMAPADRPELIFNFDATTYGTNSKQELVVYAQNSNDKAPITHIDDSGLELFVKSIFFHNAVGDLAPLVLVVMDEDMDPNSVARWILERSSRYSSVDSVLKDSRGQSRFI